MWYVDSRCDKVRNGGFSHDVQSSARTTGRQGGTGAENASAAGKRVSRTDMAHHSRCVAHCELVEIVRYEPAQLI